MSKNLEVLSLTINFKNMFTKKILLLFVFITCFSVFSQTEKNEWQIGVGASVTGFSDEDAVFIGDKFQLQIPRLNLTMPLTDHLALDGAMSFQTVDFNFISNDAKYFSMDASLRYFYGIGDSFYPYVFVGTSITDSSYKVTPTFNVGAGATYWINNKFGLNTQIYYKYSLDSFESMRSHIQITGGLVFAFDIRSVFNRRNSSAGSSFCR